MPPRKVTKTVTPKVSANDEDALYERINNNLLVLGEIDVADPEGSADLIKGIVCIFYRGGKHPECRGCNQNFDRLDACKSLYVDKISARPMDVWSPDFDKIEVREKEKFDKPPMGMQCDKCYLSEHCPKFKKMSTCAIDWSFNLESTEPKYLLEKLIKIQEERISVARAAEIIDGGTPDQNLSAEMDRMSGLVSLKQDLEADKFSLSIEGKAQGKGSGMLAQLFGNMGNKSKEVAETPVTPVIDISKIQEPKFEEERTPRRKRNDDTN